jgi:putative RNA 2'-phosphotransferase
MSPGRQKHVSKFLSLVLRHSPESVGIVLDEQGWTDVDELLRQAGLHGMPVSRDELLRVVAESDKQRFALSDDGLRVRANQGHSVPVELGLEPAVPPETLCHGTVAKFLPLIRRDGLLKGRRHHVHLSPDHATATVVGSRRGSPVVLGVASGRMHRDGLEFFVTANGVWLTDHVPPQYLTFPSAPSEPRP